MPAKTEQHALIGMILGDSYRIVRQIAVGGMGELYEASHLRLSGRYAVKVLLPQFAAHEDLIVRFAREAEITSSLRHPNIVSVFDFNTTPDGRAFLAMEFLEGHDLGADLSKRGPMALQRMIATVGQVVSALSAAHAHGVVHRDLKPQNLFISPLSGEQREIVKVLDFGISKMREASRKITREHAIIGTPQYMAPEQALGNSAAIDHRTDQFALAAISYELITGQPPFNADAIEAILYQVIHEPPPPLSRFRPNIDADVDIDTATNLEQVLLRALAKEPEARYPSISAFGQALLAAAETRPGGRTRSSATTASQHRVPPAITLREPTRRGENSNTTFGTATTTRANPRRADAYTLHRSAAPVAVTVGATILAALVWMAWVRPRRSAVAELARTWSPAAPASSAAPPPSPAPVSPPASPPPAGPPIAPQTAPIAASTTAIAPQTTPQTTGTPPPTPQAGAGAPLDPAPVRLVNPPAALRVTVDGVPVSLPLQLVRRPGQYHLRFESPGRRAQIIDLDATAPPREIRLRMTRIDRPAGSAGLDEIQPQLAPPAPADEAPPAAADHPPAARRPSLIEDVDDAPEPVAPPSSPAPSSRGSLIQEP